jgi:hypothetical protein
MTLKITASQLDLFKQEQHRLAAIQMKEYFEKGFSKLANAFPERLSVESIVESFARAEKYRFNEDQQKAKFALLTFVLGETFDLEPRNNFLLREKLLHPDVRLDHILGWVDVQGQKVRVKGRGN